MKYDTQFNTQLDTARSEFEFLKAANIETDLKLKDLKKMTTQEFYQKFEDEIREFRKEMKTSGLNSYNANMYTSHGNWLQNYRLEKARYDRALNDYNYSKQATELYKTSGLEALEGDNGIYSSNAFTSFMRELENDTSITGITNSTTGEISPELVKTWIENNPDDARVKRLQTNFQNEYNRIRSRYQNQLEELASERTLNNLSIKSTESNQGTRWGDILRERRNKPNPLYQKRGGRAARLVEYMEHYRKAQKDVADRNTETQKILWKQLNRDLDLIDKETLLLLKAAFK